MNAKELTDLYFKSKDRIKELETKVDFLEQENTKLRRAIEDMQVDIKMIQHMHRV